MKILALETATDPGSIALWVDGEVWSTPCPDGESNSASLLPTASRALSTHGLDLSDIDGIAFGAGPGSFTGLRVSCGAAQGLAVARDLSLLGVGTLEAMAHSAAAERVVVVLDARMGEIYYGFFMHGRQHGQIGVCAPEQMPLPEGEGWLACGNGLSTYPVLKERLSGYVDNWRPEIMPNAAAIACIAARRFAAGEWIDPADAVPVYVRDKVAKTVAERLAEGGRA